MEYDHKRIMFIRTNDESVDRIFKTDGYVEARRFSPAELACYVHERADPVAARKDDAPAAGQAAITNIAAVTPFSGAGGLIQTTSG